MYECVRGCLVAGSAQRPASDPLESRASWTSWATRPGDVVPPSCHCEAHHRRLVTASSSADTEWGPQRVASRSRNTRARAASRVGLVLVGCHNVHCEHGTHGIGDTRRRLCAAPALLEVAVVGARDVPGAEDGGADRLQFVVGGLERRHVARAGTPSRGGAAATDLPVRVVLRLGEGYRHDRRRADPPGRAGQRLPGQGCRGAGRSASSTVTSTSTSRWCTPCSLRSPTCRGPSTGPSTNAGVRSVLAPAAAACPGSTPCCRRARRAAWRRAGRPDRAGRRRPGGGSSADRRWRAHGRARAVAGARRGAPVPGGACGAAERVVGKAYVDAALVRSWRLLVDDAVAGAGGGPGR